MHRGRRTLRTDVARFLKTDLRNEIRLKEKDLTKEYCHVADSEIYNKILGLPEYESANMVFCFVSTTKEINTYPIIEHALAAGKKVCVPKCISQGIFHVFEITSLDCLEKGKHGIMEPKENSARVYSKDIDFGIIPCMSCNKHGERIGHGGGYYDRFLMKSTFPSAVVCRDKLINEQIPTTDHDFVIGIIVTEEGVWRV
jgi:5-formyltetrahydrofolate cyclo-ligase